MATQTNQRGKKSLKRTTESNTSHPFRQQCCSTTCASETILLHPDKAIYWPAKNTLLVADVHLGKEHAFSRAGSAIPSGPSEADIFRLANLVDASGAERLVILGDLMHSRPGNNEQWLKTLSLFLDDRPRLMVDVVAGNHDQPTAQQLIDSRIRWHANKLLDEPFVYQHEPGHDPRGHVLCGHIHPCYRLTANRADSIRAPVFWFTAQHTVLPSFGQFTGGHNVVPEKGDRLFMVGPDCVVSLK